MRYEKLADSKIYVTSLNNEAQMTTLQFNQAESGFSEKFVGGQCGSDTLFTTNKIAQVFVTT